MLLIAEFFTKEGVNASVAESVHSCLKDKKTRDKFEIKEKPWFDPFIVFSRPVF